MSQPLPTDEIKFVKIFKLEDITKTPDDSGIEYFVEIDLIYPDEANEKTKIFPFCPETETIPQDKSSDYVNEMKQNTYTELKLNM